MTTDPYTGEPVATQPATELARRFADAPDTSSYFSTTLNPVYRGLPWARLVVRNGEIVAVEMFSPTDADRRERQRAIAARTKRRDDPEPGA